MRLAMKVRLLYSILLILLFSSSTSALGVIDKEILESLRCTKMFPYFEKKLLIPKDTLHSIALQESGKKHSQHKIKVVWPWTVNVEGQGYFFNTKREAINFVKQQLLRGKESIDVGCMQINLKHHPKAFFSLEHAFDPRSNVAYGAGFLKAKYDQAGNWHEAIARYHSATPALGSKYKSSVIKIASNMAEYKDSLKGYAYNKSYMEPTTRQENSQSYKEVNKPQSWSARKNHRLRHSLAFYNKKYHSNMMMYVAPTSVLRY